MHGGTPTLTRSLPHAQLALCTPCPAHWGNAVDMVASVQAQLRAWDLSICDHDHS